MQARSGRGIFSWMVLRARNRKRCSARGIMGRNKRALLLFLRFRRRGAVELLDLLRVAVENLVLRRLLVAAQQVQDAQLVADLVFGGDDSAMVNARIGI